MTFEFNLNVSLFVFIKPKAVEAEEKVLEAVDLCCQCVAVEHVKHGKSKLRCAGKYKLYSRFQRLIMEKKRM